jgi:DDE superfamily endonuclease
MARVKLSDGRIVNSDTLGLRSSDTAHPRKSRPSSRAASAGLPSRLGHKSLPCKSSVSLSSRRPTRHRPVQTAKPEGCPSTTTPHVTDDPQSRQLHERYGASHKGQQLNKWQEVNMVGALSEWQREKSNQQQRSLREISRAWEIPYATFRRRVMSTRPIMERWSGHQSGRPTVLSKGTEDELAAHIRNLASAGFPCNRMDVRNLAFDYAARNNIKGFSTNKSSAGYYWFRGFLERQGDFVMKKAENLSVPRAMSMNKQQVSKWFEEYRELVTKLGIKDVPSHLWNTDETGCQNIHKADSVVGVINKPSYNLTALEKGETSTAVVTINAVGDCPPVMIIHKGKYIGKQWSNGAPLDTLVRASEKGYINKELFVEFGNSFVKYLAKQELTDGLPHLLLMDSHYSHLYNLEFLEIMKANKIHVFALPPHTSHWLQPLDRGVFSSFKHSWQREMKAFTRDTAGRKLEKKDFFVVFNPAFNESVTVKNAQGAFRGTGIFPLDIRAIPEHAFDPSSTSERKLPPNTLPSSVPINSLDLNSSAIPNAMLPPMSASDHSPNSVIASVATTTANNQLSNSVNSSPNATLPPMSASDHSPNSVIASVATTTANNQLSSSVNSSPNATLPPMSASDHSPNSVIASVATTTANNQLSSSVNSSPNATLPPMSASDHSPNSVPVIVSVATVTVNNQLSSCVGLPVSNQPSAPAVPEPPTPKRKVSFDEILPLPKRQRPVSVHPRKKPPSYELTGDSTMQFVRERIAKQKPKKIKPDKPMKPRKECTVKEKPGAKVKTMETEAMRQTKKDNVTKKRQANKEKDTVPCGVCKVRCCDDNYKRKWIQCQQCLVWFHYDCQGLDDKARKSICSFICVSCADSG